MSLRGRPCLVDPDNVQRVESAGRLLLSYAETDTSKHLSEFDEHLIDEALNLCTYDNAPQITALRSAVTKKNFAFVELLLSRRDTADGFLAGEHDIVHLALRDLDNEWSYHYHDRDGVLPCVVRLLLDQQAPVHTLDERGKSAVYYCCIYGSSNAFMVLMDANADIYSSFPGVPSGKGTDQSSGEAISSTSTPEVNLLQITLGSWLARQSRTYVSYEDVWRQPLDQTWPSIIIHLLNEWQRPLGFEPTDPAMLKFFYVACAQGREDVVQLLLERGISLEGAAALSDKREQIIGSALQAAVGGGQADIVQLLLRRGADLKARAPFGGVVCGGPPEIVQSITAIDAALQFEAFANRQSEVLNACMLLVDAGASEVDCHILLRRCIKSHNLDLTRRLLEKGVRVPVGVDDLNVSRFDRRDPLEIVQLLESFQLPLDYASIQSHAAEKGQVKLLWYLVNSGGPRIPRTALWDIIGEAVQRKPASDINMLRYLVNEYGLDVNETFPGYNGKGLRSMLSIAVNVKNIYAIDFLLKQSARVALPGLDPPMLPKFREDLVGRGGLGYDQVAVARVILAEQTPDMWRAQGDDFVPLRTLLDLGSTSLSNEAEFAKTYNKDRRTVAYDAAYAAPYAPSTSNDLAVVHISALEGTAEEFVHKPLSGLKPFRLLELEPAESTLVPLSCRVRHFDLQDGEQYEALSCAQYDIQPPVPISLDGALFSVSKTLWETLLRLRQPTKPRTIWVEQICVENADIDERTQQMRLLPEIYSNAQSVICWLGEAGDGSNTVFKYLRQWKPEPREYSRQPQRPQFSGAGDAAFRKLMRRPWFHETSSLLAVASNKHTMLMCGAGLANWEKVSEAVGGRRSPRNGIWDSLRGLDENARWQAIDDLRDSYKRRLNLESRLTTAFQAVAVTEARGPRDKVFAVALLANMPEVSIDYSISVSKLYSLFTEHAIRGSNNIQVLHWQGCSFSKVDRLPSWVPDFSISRPVGVLPRVAATSHYKDHFPFKVLPALRFVGNTLVLLGKHVDVIRAVGKVMLCDSDHAVGCGGFEETLRDWELLVADTKSVDVPGRPYIQAKAPLQDFLSTLAAGEQGDAGWYKRFGTNVLGKIDLGTIREYEDLTALEDWAGVRKKYPTAYITAQGHFTEKVESIVPGRRFFVTATGAMGLAHPLAELGDSIVFFPGGLYPFVLRKGHDDCYMLVGDCYLNGFDEVDLMDYEQQPAEEFCLV